MCAGIRDKGESFTQDDLEEVLAHTYSPVNLVTIQFERPKVSLRAKVGGIATHPALLRLC